MASTVIYEELHVYSVQSSEGCEVQNQAASYSEFLPAGGELCRVR
jgi:hypothetical protein